MDRLLNTKQIADYLGIQESTVYQWSHRGFIPHYKVGKFLRFRIDDIEKWLKKRRVAGRVSRGVDISRYGI